MQSQRELFERQIELERASSKRCPTRSSPSSPRFIAPRASPARTPSGIAERLFPDPETALDVLVLRSGPRPRRAGLASGAQRCGSFSSFAVGTIPVVPYLFGCGSAVFVASLLLSLAALFAVGAGVSLLTGGACCSAASANYRRRGRGGDLRDRHATAWASRATERALGADTRADLDARLRAEGLDPGAWSTARTTATRP